DAIAQHRDALDAHAERPAGHFLGVVPHVPEDTGMNHPGAQDLEPARSLADAAAAALAEDAEHVHLRRGLGEREERRTEPDAALRAEQLPREQLQRALEIAHRDAAIDREALHLVEHRGVRDVRVPAVHAARADDTHRRLLTLHGPDLDRG